MDTIRRGATASVDLGRLLALVLVLVLDLVLVPALALPRRTRAKDETSSRYDDNDDEFEVNNARASFHSRSEGASASLSAGRSSAHRKGQQSGRSRVAVQPFHESSRRIRGQFAQRRIVDDEERRRQAHEREAARRERIRRRNVMIRKSNRPLWHAKGKENVASGGSSKASAGSGDRVRAEYLARGARKPPVPRLSKSFLGSSTSSKSNKRRKKRAPKKAPKVSRKKRVPELSRMHLRGNVKAGRSRERISKENPRRQSQRKRG